MRPVRITAAVGRIMKTPPARFAITYPSRASTPGGRTSSGARGPWRGK